MKEEQMQMKKELKGIAVKIDRLETEVKLLIKALKQNYGLEQGLKELSEGKYHTYKSVAELDKAIRKRNLA